VFGDRGTRWEKATRRWLSLDLGDMHARSHGGLSDRNVYLTFSRPRLLSASEIMLNLPATSATID